jgi:hypothetical protein
VQHPTLATWDLGDLGLPWETHKLRANACWQFWTIKAWLRPEARLVVVGDYFDFGSAAERVIASRDGLRNLAWLAAHSPEQVVLLIGNHDLARVGELHYITDAEFETAFSQASALYARRGVHTDEDTRAVKRFLEQFTMFPTLEIAARDLSGFCEAQRDLVARLLRQGRFQLAWHASGILVNHAGVTHRYLDQLSVSQEARKDAATVAKALNDALLRATQNWDGTSPFEIPGLHVVGNAARGESWGLLFHRPVHPERLARAQDVERRRRYLPSELPDPMVQVVGHVRDNKCRQLLGDWVHGPAREGALRSLAYSGGHWRYELGVQASESALLVFVDGGMNSAECSNYELLNIEKLIPHVPGLVDDSSFK